MHGQRVTHTLQVSVLDKVEKLTELLILKEPDEIEQYLVIKYVYPMGRIQTLDKEKTF